MKFTSGSRRRALEYEKDWVEKWKKDKTFEKSVENRSKDNSYVFYDGPPFISGVPHHGTLLSSIVKDAVPRYQTMKGKRVERVWGWDCHGLPAERYTEKKLGIKSREEVIEYGIERYINATRQNMEQTSSEWEDVIDRIGRWVDFEGAYKTMDKDYMESVWWAFKTLYEKGSIYEGEKVLMYCTLDGTPLSKAEVTMDAGAYQDVTDPSVYVKFKLEDGRVLLAWTTTPWTLPANTALAVNKDVTYVEVELDGEKMIVAKDLAKKIFVDEKHQPLEYKVLREFTGEELVGLSYEPLFNGDYFKTIYGKRIRRTNTKTSRRLTSDDVADEKTEVTVTEFPNATYTPLDINVFNDEKDCRVWHADFVEIDAGTGIVHMAPAYGEDDFEAGRRNGNTTLHVLDENGVYFTGQWRDKNVWDINKQIAKDLKEQGVVWKIDYIRHSYPHCHRCGTRLMYRAHPSWFMDIDGQRTKMLEKNEPINWFPPHVKHGRFEKTIEQAPDWNISRDRFWATAMPVWKSKSGKVKVVGSYDELETLSGKRLDDYHRPWIDEVTFMLDGEEYTRIDKVMDSWFEAGSMPFAQFHYPFENKEKFEANFPGDFIVEYIGQVRAWFYYMHAMSVALFGENSFKNVIVTGNVAGNDGRKMSKSYGNYTDPNELMDKFSADSLRFLLLSSPLLSGEDFVLQDKEVGDVARKLSMIWNMYDFFTMYAEVDDVTFPYDDTGKSFVPELDLERLSNPLDIWIVSRLHQLVAEVEKHMDAYNIPDALSPILPFIDDASNWYVRRSRRRFWRASQGVEGSQDDTDKDEAYRTLHYVLTRLAYVLAPFTPFLAEELYHKLTGDTQSIHLKDWLPAGRVNELVMNSMEIVREYVNQGLSLRAKSGVKVRQPLSEVVLEGQPLDDYYREIITEELNVKTATFVAALDSRSAPDAVYSERVGLITTITPELKREGLVREVIRHVQNARKDAGLNVDDRIVLALTTTDDELQTAVKEFAAIIQAETLAETLQDDSQDGHVMDVVIEGKELRVCLKKA